MTMFSSLRSFLTESLQVRSKVGTDIYGKTSYGVVRDFKGAVVRDFMKIINTNGEEVISSIQIYTEEDITEHDLISIDNKEKAIKSVAAYKDFTTNKFSLRVIYL